MTVRNTNPLQGKRHANFLKTWLLVSMTGSCTEQWNAYLLLTSLGVAASSLTSASLVSSISTSAILVCRKGHGSCQLCVQLQDECVVSAHVNWCTNTSVLICSITACSDTDTQVLQAWRPCFRCVHQARGLCFDDSSIHSVHS